MCIAYYQTCHIKILENMINNISLYYSHSPAFVACLFVDLFELASLHVPWAEIGQEADLGTGNRDK